MKYILYGLVLMAIVSRIFEIKDDIKEVVEESESKIYKIVMAVLAILMKGVIISFTIFFSNYFIESIFI